MKLGRLADFRAQLKIREILFVLTNNEAYMSEKPKFTCSFSMVAVVIGAKKVKRIISCLVQQQQRQHWRQRQAGRDYREDGISVEVELKNLPKSAGSRR